jgi:alpha-tubulin suppressor-like RCC1 family protein
MRKYFAVAICFSLLTLVASCGGGNGSTDPSSFQVTATSAGRAHTIALMTDGTLWAWGDNLSGQLGDGTIEDKYTPVQIGTDSDWESVSAGSIHTTALKTDGTLWA